MGKRRPIQMPSVGEPVDLRPKPWPVRARAIAGDVMLVLGAALVGFVLRMVLS